MGIGSYLFASVAYLMLCFAFPYIRKQQPSPELIITRREGLRFEAPTNGSWVGPSESLNELSPKSPDYDGLYDVNGAYHLDRRYLFSSLVLFLSLFTIILGIHHCLYQVLAEIVAVCSNRRRQRPQRYSAKEFVEAVSDNEADFDSDDDIVGEVIYDDEYLRKRKQRRKMSSSSEGDDEYHCDDDNPEEEEEEEDDDVDSLSASEESDGPQKFKKLPGRTRRETKLRSVDELQLGLRRSKRATRNRIDYRQYELSESETEYMKPGKSNALAEHSNESENADEFSMASQDSEENIDNQDMKVDEPLEEQPETVKTEENHLPEKADSPRQSEGEGVRKRRFLDLNELAPGSGFDDGPNSMMKDEDTDDF